MFIGIIVIAVAVILLLITIHWVQVSCYDSEKLRKAMKESDEERIVRIVEAEDTMFKRLLKKAKGVER